MSAAATTSVLAMNDRPGGELPEEEDAVFDTPVSEAVTYTIKVLSDVIGPGGEAHRRVLFQRTEAGRTIELCAETDAVNLLAALPDFLEAALETQRALWPAQPATACAPAARFFPRFAEELRRIRWLARGGRPGPRRRGRRDDAPRPRGAPRGRRRR